MKRSFRLCLLVCTTFACAQATLAAGRTPSRMVETLGNVVVGQPPPGFAGWDLSGELFSFSRWQQDNKAKRPLIVSFFASWCAPCRKGLPVIAAVAKKRDADVVLIAFGEDKAKAEQLLKELNIKLPALPDPNRKIAARLGVEGTLPWTAVLDGAGITRALFAEEGFDFEKRLDKVVSSAARSSGKPRNTPSPQSTPAKKTSSKP